MIPEQIAFEKMARNGNFSLQQHPLHYLFTDEKTDALRRGWNAGRSYEQRSEERKFLFTVRWHEYDERGQKSRPHETEYQVTAATEGKAWFMVGQVFNNIGIEYEISLALNLG